MNIDKALFLALAASLSTVACSAETEGEDTDDAAGAASGYCWEPTKESQAFSASGKWFAGNIGADPVADPRAAKAFCAELAYKNAVSVPGDTATAEYGVYLAEKCENYAKLYVPYTTYFAFQRMKETAHGRMSLGRKWDALYALDKEIHRDSHVCRSPRAQLACADKGAERENCEVVASQMKPEAQPTLTNCVGQFTAYTCMEGAWD